MEDKSKRNGPREVDGNPTPDKSMPEAARRALEEAEQRRVALSKTKDEQRREINGRGGLDPARYGDWEKKGIAVDF